MMSSVIVTFLIGATVSVACPCQSPNDLHSARLPTYGDLEQQYALDKSLNTSVRAFREAIPTGTSLIEAERKLAGLDVDCKKNGSNSRIYKCILAHYQLDDGSEDVIRWTIYLQTADYKVINIALDRYFDFKPGY